MIKTADFPKPSLISVNGVELEAFETSGFTGSINWYRNIDSNWHLLADVKPIIQQEKPKETPQAILKWLEQWEM